MSGSRPRGPRTLGVIAFALAVTGTVVGTVLQFLSGRRLGEIAQFVDLPALVRDGQQIDPASLGDTAARIVSEANTLSVIAFIVWILLALWAAIQGILAIVRRRGRAWGIAAVSVTVAGFFIIQIAYTVGLTTSATSFL